MYKHKRNRKVLLCSLFVLLLIMAVGYAAFYSQLQILGTSEVTSLWDVEITGIEKSQTNGNVTEIENPTYTKDSATFNVGLEKPGDYIYYKVEVTNKGSVAAMATLGNLSCGNREAIECGAYPDSSISTSIQGNQDLTSSRLIIGPNEKEYYNVWVSYSSDITTQPEITNTNITLELTYKQSDVGITHKTEDNCYTSKVLENGTLEITDYNESCGTDVVIPETIDGYTVTEIADGIWDEQLHKVVSVFGGKGITSVSFPNTLTYIGSYSFNGNNINNLIIPSNVKSIGLEAFSNSNINQLTLSEGIETIGVEAFMNNNLTEINIPTSVTNLGGGSFTSNKVNGDRAIIYGRNSAGTIDYTTLNSYAGEETINFNFPSSVTNISSFAFRNVKMENLTIPGNIKLANRAFFLSSIDNLILEEGIESIGVETFNGCGILSVNFPNSLKSIGAEAFTENHLTQISLGQNIQTIGENAFQSINGYNPITSITINKAPNTVSGSPWGATNAKINWIG